MKRRGRPSNHSPDCAEKQAERLRELKLLSANEAPPVMEPVAGMVLPWRGTNETAGASSSRLCVGVSRGSLTVVMWKSLKSVR